MGDDFDALARDINPLGGHQARLLDGAAQLLQRAGEVVECVFQPLQRLTSAIGVQQGCNDAAHERHQCDAGPYVVALVFHVALPLQILLSGSCVQDNCQLLETMSFSLVCALLVSWLRASRLVAEVTSCCIWLRRFPVLPF